MPWVNEGNGQFNHYYGVNRCFACEAQLQPVFGETDCDQYLDALDVEFSGGYGMLIDPDYWIEEHIKGKMGRPWPHVVICKSCALELIQLVPWVHRLLGYVLNP